MTGGRGFAGSHLVELLESHGHVVFAPKVDLLNETELASALNGKTFDGAVHLAAIASSADSFKSPGEILKNNILAQLNLLEELRHHNPQARILIICSGDEYGSSADNRLDERSPLLPTTPYAVSKVAQDFLGLQYHLAHQMHIIRVRPFNHIGERQALGFVVPDFTKQVVEIERSTKPGAIMVGNLEPMRDFTDVKDMVWAYELALLKGVPGQVYNIGSGMGVRIKTILKILIGLSPATISVKLDPAKMRPGEKFRLVCNSNKFRELTGWQPTIPLRYTLERVLEYWREKQ